MTIKSHEELHFWKQNKKVSRACAGRNGDTSTSCWWLLPHYNWFPKNLIFVKFSLTLAHMRNCPQAISHLCLEVFASEQGSVWHDLHQHSHLQRRHIITKNRRNFKKESENIRKPDVHMWLWRYRRASNENNRHPGISSKAWSQIDIASYRASKMYKSKQIQSRGGWYWLFIWARPCWINTGPSKYFKVESYIVTTNYCYTHWHRKTRAPVNNGQPSNWSNLSSTWRQSRFFLCFQANIPAKVERRLIVSWPPVSCKPLSLKKVVKRPRDACWTHGQHQNKTWWREQKKNRNLNFLSLRHGPTRMLVTQSRHSQIPFLYSADCSQCGSTVVERHYYQKT